MLVLQLTTKNINPSFEVKTYDVVAKNGGEYAVKRVDNNKVDVTDKKTGETKQYDITNKKDREKLENLLGKDVLKQIVDWVRQQQELMRSQQTGASAGKRNAADQQDVSWMTTSKQRKEMGEERDKALKETDFWKAA